MTTLVYEGRDGRNYEFGLEEGKLTEVGNRKSGDIRIPDDTVDEKHALIELVSGNVFLTDLRSRNGTLVDGVNLEPYQRQRVNFGARIELGRAKLTLRDGAPAYEPGRGVVPALARLDEWWELAEESTTQPPDIDQLRELCGLHVLWRGEESRELIEALSAKYVAEALKALPVALPLVADLATMVLASPPPFRRVSPDAPDATAAFLSAYQSAILRPLAYSDTVTFVRERLNDDVSPDNRRRVAFEFVRRVLEWIWDRWVEQDVRDALAEVAPSFSCTAPDLGRLAQDKGRWVSAVFAGLSPDEQFASANQLIERLTELAPRRMNAIRTLCDGAQVQGFMTRILEVVHLPASVITPEDRFLLGAGAKVDSAFTVYDAPLIAECLSSHDLTDRRFEVKPVTLAHRWPEVPCPSPGDRMDIRAVRTTTDLDKIIEALPQELALLKRGEDGKRTLLHKATDSGFLIPERREMMREETRRRFLVCFAADIGPEAQQAVKAQRGALVPSVHARRLIFDSLRDLARFLNPREVDLTAQIFLEPIRGLDRQARLVWQIGLDELQGAVTADRQDFMIEVEDRAPGFFFMDNRAKVSAAEDHFQYVEDVLGVGSFERVLFVILAPKSTLLSAMVPDDPPSRRRRQGEQVVVTLVALEHWWDWVETTTGDGFDDVSLRADFRMEHDDTLRVSILEALLGDQSDDPADSAEILFEGVES